MRRLTIGRFPTISLAAARAAARPLLQDAALGKDPATARKEKRDADSFGELARIYVERYAREHKRSWEADQKMLNHDLLPMWANRKADSIERKDVIALLDRIVERGSPVQANRTLSCISKIFAFGVGRDLVKINPAYQVEKPGAEHSDDRFLNDTEIVLLWRALDDEPADLRDSVRLLLLTGQRKTEVTAMKWYEIDGDEWTIPPARTKNKRRHLVPLCSQTAAILQARRALVGESEYVFPNTDRASGSIAIR